MLNICIFLIIYCKVFDHSVSYNQFYNIMACLKEGIINGQLSHNFQGGVSKWQGNIVNTIM
jgi:hypothetical protein